MNSGALIVRLAALGVAAALAACDSPKTALEADDLHRAARDTASVAAEGSMFVSQIRQGNVGANYVWVHQEALREEGRKAAEPLHKPVPPALREQLLQIETLGQRLDSDLAQVGFAIDDAARLQGIGRSLKETSERAVALKGDK